MSGRKAYFPNASDGVTPKPTNTAHSLSTLNHRNLDMLYKCTIFALQNGITMNTASVTRKQTSFRLSENLLERLQIEAKKHNRSLNNLVESVLLAFVSEKPNKTTLAAMKEAETSDNLETLDLSNFRNFVDSL